MTVLVKPPTIDAATRYPAGATTPATCRPRHRVATMHPRTPLRRRCAVGVATAPRQSVGQRDPTGRDLTAGHSDRANPGTATVSRAAGDPGSAIGIGPLPATGPVRVDDYRLVSLLGTGGMADVFYAVTPAGAPVAVKLLRDRGADGVPETCQREYGLASAVDSDCTAPTIGHGMSTAGAYLVTAYLPGYRCGTTLLGRSSGVGRLLTLGSALARVLTAIHAKGIVHCDVKPSNLLVEGHDVRVIDFGIARYAGESADDGTVQCTRGWAAPEQLHAAPVTPAVDIFAWGCLLALLATGVHPFASQTVEEWIARLQSGEPDLHSLPRDLDAVIRATLARDPLNRPNADELTTICRAALNTRDE